MSGAWTCCPNDDCNQVMSEAWTFCPFCGTEGEEDTDSERCTQCGYFVGFHWWFCPGCGASHEKFSSAKYEIFEEDDEDDDEDWQDCDTVSYTTY